MDATAALPVATAKRMLGIQHNRQTPPGMYVYIHTLLYTCGYLNTQLHGCMASAVGEHIPHCYWMAFHYTPRR